MISTLGFSQDDMLKDIVSLHLKTDTFDLDPCFGNGGFYKVLPKPKLCFDISPVSQEVQSSDCTSLPLPDESIGSIIFDPPFICGHKTDEGKAGIIKSRFSSFRKVNELWAFYYLSMKEFFRVLKDDGCLVFKCQDTVEDHKNHFTHCEIMSMALDIGLYPKDLFVLGAKHRLPRANQSKQEHARKFHCFFWVFLKQKCKVKYGNWVGEISTPSHMRD